MSSDEIPPETTLSALIYHTLIDLFQVNIHASGARKRGRGGRAFRPTLSGATTDPTRPETPQSDYSDQLNESDGAVNAPTSADEAEPSECVASTVRTALSERNNIPRSRLDPPQGYVRMVSSTHLDPSRNICFPANSSALVDLLKWSSTLDNATDRLRTTRTAQFCALSCGRFKRYTCAKTGLPLCSLGCYRNNLARVEANKTAVGGV